MRVDEHGFCACRKLRLAQAAEANMQYFIDLAEERDQQCKALRAQLAQTQRQPPAPYASVLRLRVSFFLERKLGKWSETVTGWWAGLCMLRR